MCEKLFDENAPCPPLVTFETRSSPRYSDSIDESSNYSTASETESSSIANCSKPFSHSQKNIVLVPTAPPLPPVDLLQCNRSSLSSLKVTSSENHDFLILSLLYAYIDNWHYLRFFHLTLPPADNSSPKIYASRLPETITCASSAASPAGCGAGFRESRWTWKLATGRQRAVLHFSFAKKTPDKSALLEQIGAAYAK